jgi:hypothetical protein
MIAIVDREVTRERVKMLQREIVELSATIEAYRRKHSHTAEEDRAYHAEQARLMQIVDELCRLG